DDPGEARDAEGLEHGARRARVLPLDLRHVPHALGRDQLDPLVLAEPARGLVPRVHRSRDRVRGRADLRPPAAPARADDARVPRVARGDVPQYLPPALRTLSYVP